MKETKIGMCNDDFDVIKLKKFLINNDAGKWGSDPKGDEGKRVVRSTNFNSTGYLDLSKVAVRKLSQEEFDKTELMENDIIIERSGGSANQPVGRVSFITPEVSKHEYGFSNFIQRLRVNDKNDAKYLFYCLYYLHSAGFTKTMQTQTNGIRNLEYRYYLNQKFPKPDKIEQIEIAKALSLVDQNIIDTKNSISKLEKLKKSLIQNLLSGKIKPDGRFRSEQEYWIDEKFGKIPNGWKPGTLKDIAEIVAGVSPSGETYNKNGIGAPILNGPAEFTDKYPIPVQFSPKATRFAIEGDILFCVRGSTTGRMNFADQKYGIGRGIAAIRPNSDYRTNFLHKTLVLIINKLFAIAKSSGTTFPNVSKGELRKKKIIYPICNKEKDEISLKFETVESNIELKQKKIKRLENLKTSMMQNLLIGKMRIRLSKQNFE